MWVFKGFDKLCAFSAFFVQRLFLPVGVPANQTPSEKVASLKEWICSLGEQIHSFREDPFTEGRENKVDGDTCTSPESVSILFKVSPGIIFEPAHYKTYKMVCAPCEDSDQPWQSDQSSLSAWRKLLNERTAKTLITLGWYPGLFESSLSAHAIILVLWCTGSFISSRSGVYKMCDSWWRMGEFYGMMLYCATRFCIFLLFQYVRRYWRVGSCIYIFIQ